MCIENCKGEHKGQLFLLFGKWFFDNKLPYTRVAVTCLAYNNEIEYKHFGSNCCHVTIKLVSTSISAIAFLTFASL